MCNSPTYRRTHSRATIQPSACCITLHRCHPLGRDLDSCPQHLHPLNKSIINQLMGNGMVLTLPPVCCFVVFSNALICRSESWKGLLAFDLRDSRALSLGFNTLVPAGCGSEVWCGEVFYSHGEERVGIYCED